MHKVCFFDFDISLPVEKRWGPIFDHYLNIIPEIYGKLNTILNQFGMATSIAKQVYNITSEKNILHYDEICYIAKRMNMDPYHILLM